MRLQFALLAAVAAVSMALPAHALPLVENSGWQDDIINSRDAPSLNSAWTFTIGDNAVFSVADCCIVGDVYKLFDTAT